MTAPFGQVAWITIGVLALIVIFVVVLDLFDVAQVRSHLLSLHPGPRPIVVPLDTLILFISTRRFSGF